MAVEGEVEYDILLAAGGETKEKLNTLFFPFHVRGSCTPSNLHFPDDGLDVGNAFRRAMPWLADDFGMKDAPSSIFPGLSLVQWMSMQQNNQFPASQSGLFPSMISSNTLNGNLSTDDPSKLLNFQSPTLSTPNVQFNKPSPQNQGNQLPPSMGWNQQPPLQQLFQNPMNQQHQPYSQQPYPQQQQQRRSPQPQQQLQSQEQIGQQTLQIQQHQHQEYQSAPVTNGVILPNQIPNKNTQHPFVCPQLQQQQQLLASNTQSQSIPSSKSSYQLTSLPQDTQFQQPEPEPNLLQRQQQTQLQQSPPQVLQQSLSQRAQPQPQPQVQQISQTGLTDQQLHLLMAQRLQQQQHQLLSPTNSLLQPQQQQLQQQTHQQIQQPQQVSLSQIQQQTISNSSLSTAALLKVHAFPLNQSQNLQKPTIALKAHSTLTDGHAPSCSTSPSTNNCQISPSNFLNKNQQPLTAMMVDSVVEPASNLIQGLHSKSDIHVQSEFPSTKGSDQLQPKCRGTITDQLEASSSGTSYFLDAGTIQHNFSVPTFGLEGDVQSNPQNNLPLASIDGLAPDTLLSRGYDSQKDLQNLLSNYGGNPRDIDRELSTAPISSQSFGVPNIPGCSNDVAINDTRVLNGGIWGNQPQRMRTYTKVCHPHLSSHIQGMLSFLRSRIEFYRKLRLEMQHFVLSQNGSYMVVNSKYLQNGLVVSVFPLVNL